MLSDMNVLMLLKLNAFAHRISKDLTNRCMPTATSPDLLTVLQT